MIRKFFLWAMLALAVATSTPAVAGDDGPVARAAFTQALTTAKGGTPYLGQVATRTRFPGRFKTDFTDGMWRRADYIRDDVKSLRLVYADFTLTAAGEINPGFALTIVGASVEFPAGVFTRVTFNGGSNSATMTNGQAQLVSDPVAISIPRGSQIWVQTRTSGTGYIYAEYGYRSAIGDKVSLGTSSLPDSTMATFTSANAGLQFGPTAILATTNRPAVALVADSRVQGVGDPGGSFASATYIGEVAPGIAPYFAVLDMSQGGEQAANDAAGQYAKRATYLPYVSHGVIELGINDINNGQTPAQTLASRAAIRAFGPASVKWLDTTVTPQSSSTVAISALSSSGTTATATIPATHAAALKVGQTIAVAGAVPTGYNGTVVVTAISGQQISYTLLAGATGLATATTNGTLSDLWASIAFQTTSSQNPNRVTLNELIRGGNPGVEAYFELADGSESFRNSGLWGVLIGSPTADGLHGNFIAWTQDQKALNPALIKRTGTTTGALDFRDLPHVPANDNGVAQRAMAG